jgi:hypothetical protein
VRKYLDLTSARTERETPMRYRVRLTFGLRTMFALTLVCAWCAWQWGIAVRRVDTCNELSRLGYCIHHNDFILNEGARQLDVDLRSAKASREAAWRVGIMVLSHNQVCGDQWQDPFRGSVFGALVGWDNWRGLTVIIPTRVTVGASPRAMESAFAALHRLPRLTRVVMIDYDPATESDQKIIQFKAHLKRVLPGIPFIHRHDGSHTVPVVG